MDDRICQGERLLPNIDFSPMRLSRHPRINFSIKFSCLFAIYRVKARKSRARQ